MTEKRDASVVVTFPPWKHEWDREIVDPNEVRSKTQEDVLVPRRFANKKVKIINVSDISTVLVGDFDRVNVTTCFSVTVEIDLSFNYTFLSIPRVQI